MVCFNVTTFKVTKMVEDYRLANIKNKSKAMYLEQLKLLTFRFFTLSICKEIIRLSIGHLKCKNLPNTIKKMNVINKNFKTAFKGPWLMLGCIKGE